MNHPFASSTLEPETCARCGYAELSHGDSAVCEACGAETKCELYPNLTHPKKMLLCSACIKKEYELAKKLTDERVAAHQEIKSSSDYFNANIPAIMELKQTIDNDPNIQNKTEAIATAVKNRLTHLQETLLSKHKEVTELEHEKRETLVYLNHMQSQLSAEAQQRLGLLNLTYKPVVKTPKKATAPSTKKYDKTELKKVALMYGIDEVLLQTIVVRKQMTIEEAAKSYIKANNKAEEAEKVND